MKFKAFSLELSVTLDNVREINFFSSTGMLSLAVLFKWVMIRLMNDVKNFVFLASNSAWEDKDSEDREGLLELSELTDLLF